MSIGTLIMLIFYGVVLGGGSIALIAHSLRNKEI